MNEFDQLPGNKPRILPLPVRLRELNNMLGWRASDMADWMGKDAAEISRWLSLKKPHKLQDSTLEFVARRYQEAGVEGVTFEELKNCRDFGGQADIENPFQMPENWVRLVQRVMSYDADFQDKMLLKWSLDLDISSQLLHRGIRRDLKLTDLTEDQSRGSMRTDTRRDDSN